MIDFSEETVTNAVIQQLEHTPDPRMREIMYAAVRHLHAFAREVHLTHEEWLAGINFLTAVGKTCSVEHQEFILLSDTLGLTTLVNVLQDRSVLNNSTSASVLGPFYRHDTPIFQLGDSIARIKAGPEAVMYGHVQDGKGNPIAHAELDVWLADSEGQYDIQAYGPGVSDLRGRFVVDGAGKYWFRTTLPKGYSIPMGGPVGALVQATARAGMRPAHIHFLVRAAAYRPLVTALYISGDPYIETDAAFGVAPELIVSVLPPAPEAPIDSLPRIRYDFILAAHKDNR